MNWFLYDNGLRHERVNLPAESSFSILAASACEIHEPLFLSLLSLIPFQNRECDSLIHIHCHRFVI